VSRTVAVLLILTACHRKAPEGAPPPSEAQTISIPTAAPHAAAVPVAGAAHVIDASAPVVRATRVVVVDGVNETWSLRWRGAPDSVCGDAMSAACQGFAFGEQGSLELLRERPGAATETLALDKLFDDGLARLQKYAPHPGDGLLTVDAPFLAGRPVVDVMKLGDYDHDGRATEFVLQIGANAYGHQPSIVVGISTADPRLHAFTSASDPKTPLALETPGAWERVKNATRAVTLVQVRCGDHGATEEEDARITFKGGILDVTRKKKPCSAALDPLY